MTGNQVLVPSPEAVTTFHTTTVALLLPILAKCRILDTIPESDRFGITLQTLAARHNIPIDLMRRLLRPLLSCDILRAEGETIFHTEKSLRYRTDAADARFAVMMSSFVYGTLPFLGKWIEAQTSCAEETAALTRPASAFAMRFANPDGSLYQILLQHPDMSYVLHNGLATMDVLHPYVGYYDFLPHLAAAADTDGKDQIRLVDVGGGNGQFLSELLLRHPQEIEPQWCTLQDSAQTIDVARSNPELPSSVRCQVYDFFEAQPVHGAAFYHIRACLHNWNDEKCMQILKNISDAMSDYSKLVIAENVLEDDGVPCTAASCMDIAMMLLGGKERTRSQFEELLHMSGLTMTTVTYTVNSWAMIEAVKLVSGDVRAPSTKEREGQRATNDKKDRDVSKCPSTVHASLATPSHRAWAEDGEEAGPDLHSP